MLVVVFLFHLVIYLYKIIMSTADEITPEQVEKTLVWVQASFAAAETFDNQLWITGFFYPDATIAYSGQAPMQGHEALIADFDYFTSRLTSIKHHAEHVDVLSDRVYIQARVEFVLKNDPEQKTLSFEGMVAIQKKIDEDKASFYKIYTDKTLLEERIKMFG
jgi:hypothetical protein